MSDLLELFNTDFFRIGLRLGVLALALGWALVFATRRVRRPLPVAGILITVGVGSTLMMLGQDISTEVVAFALIMAGAGFARYLKAADWIVAVSVAPGALWLGLGTSTTNLVWVRVAMVILIPFFGFLVADFESRFEGMGLGVVFYGLAALGVFVAVPDTEWARVLIAVAVPVVFLAWPSVTSSLGVEGAYLAVATLIVVTARGGGPRPASIVGGIASLGLLLLEPIAIRMMPGIVKLTTWFQRNWAGVVMVSLPQFVVVALTSRVAARFTREIPAFVVVVLVYGATLAVGFSASTGEGTKVPEP